MDLKYVLAELDQEIAALERARALLSGRGNRRVAGRPVGKRPKKRRLTPEGRARIAEAVKRRWAAQKKADKQ